MKKVKLSIIVSYIIIQFISLVIPITSVQADIAEGDTITLQGDHKCDPLLEYWMTDYQRWSYKVVWYVYYQDKETNQKYPAFCIEPKKNGIGTGYDSYQATLSKEQDNGIWRILNKGRSSICSTAEIQSGSAKIRKNGRGFPCCFFRRASAWSGLCENQERTEALVWRIGRKPKEPGWRSIWML